MKSLLGMSLAELQNLVAQHNMPKFTAKQLVDWLYRKRVTSFDEMTNLSKQTRQILAENYETGYRAYAGKRRKQDGGRDAVASQHSQCHQLCRHRGSDVGAVNYRSGLRQRHYADVHEADYHHCHGSRALDCSSANGADADARQFAASHSGK